MGRSSSHWRLERGRSESEWEGIFTLPWATNPVIEQVPGIQPTRARVACPLLWKRHHAGLRWNYWRSWRLWSPRPGFISCATTGVLAPRARGRIVPTKPVAGGGGRRYERSVLHPSPGVADPAGAGLFLRPRRMRDLWRAPEDRRRPDRSGLDPDLFGGHRAAGGASAEGPAVSAVRVRRLTSSAIRSLRREP